jgi:hypothetical protein
MSANNALHFPGPWQLGIVARASDGRLYTLTSLGWVAWRPR